MKKMRYNHLFFFLLLIFNCFCFAQDEVPSSTPMVEKNFSPFTILQADWVFSGTVTNESGEHYSYYFQMQRKDTAFHVMVTLIDSQNKEVLLFEEAKAIILEPQANNWRVGRAFLQFNPITNSWIFGATTQAKKGFNFKVDMLKRVEKTAVLQSLHNGVEFSIDQTGPLNGHLQTGDDGKEQFVTADKAWFRQLRVSKAQKSVHPLTGVLCQFDDGSNFYALNMHEEEILKDSVAVWHNGQGAAIPVSQFISIKQAKDGIWSIRIPSPKIRLSLRDALSQASDGHQLVAGLTEGVKPGFCTITKEEIA